MQTIGERLEEARKRKGITIREAAEATKIRGDYLNSFENNNFSISIPEIYTRGFLRNYAQFLKLNADKIVTDYNATLLGEGKMPKRENREFFGRVELHSPLIEEEPKPEKPKPAPEEEPEQEASPQEPVAPWWQNLDKELLIKVGIAGIIALLLLLVLIWAFKSIVSSDSPADAPSGSELQEIVPAAQDSFTLIATGDLRVTVVQIEPRLTLYDGPLAAGESKEIVKTGRAVITYSIGSNLQVEIDGRRSRMPVEGRGRSPIP